MININIENKTIFKFKFKRIYKKIVKETLKELGIKGNAELSVIILNNKGIKEISKKYRNKDVATDILSFPTGYEEISKFIGYNLLGDIYLSYEKIEAQAKEFEHTSKREWSYLFVHGILHLLGYDHKNQIEEKNMNSIAYNIMEKVKVRRHG